MIKRLMPLKMKRTWNNFLVGAQASSFLYRLKPNVYRFEIFMKIHNLTQPELFINNYWSCVPCEIGLVRTDFNKLYYKLFMLSLRLKTRMIYLRLNQQYLGPV